MPDLLASPHPHNLVWLDMEMTGLKPEHDRILEIAVIVTNAELDEIATAPVIVLHQEESLLSQMDSWNQSTHHRSGLLTKVRASNINESMAQQQMLDFLKAFVPAKTSPLCGNSICQDRRFLANYMPELEAYFHYRNLDVSTLKELCKRWYPDIAKSFVKKQLHTALADVEESIAELRYYRQHLLRPQQPLL